MKKLIAFFTFLCLAVGTTSANGSIDGQPYNEVMTYTQEDLYEPKWAETPLPPDLRPYLPRIRQLLLEGKPDEANAWTVHVSI